MGRMHGPRARAQVDRPSASPERCGLTASSLLDLFLALGASEEQSDFPLLYASAREVHGEGRAERGRQGGGSSSGVTLMYGWRALGRAPAWS